MRVSIRGMIDILAREGICLVPYLDSVGVWTIGAGQTKSDGIDPREMGEITLDAAIALFKRNIAVYDNAVTAENQPFTQYEHDALVSAAYNFGVHNLHTLCSHRNIVQIGQALTLYNRPSAIIRRRREEQRLYQSGIYSNHDGHVNLFPVTVSHHPNYHAGKMVDVRPYFSEGLN